MNFNHFISLYRGERIDRVIVCNLHPDIAASIGARVTRVYLSSETLEKQKRRHPDLQEFHYRALRPAINLGEYRQETERTAVVLFVDSRLTGLSYRAHIKATENGREIYANSFCLLGKRQYRAELRRPYPIIRTHQPI